MVDQENQDRKGKVTYPELEEEDKPLYSNAILVNNTPWDFALHFSHLVLPVVSPAESSGEVEVKGKKVVVISIPATLVRGLIRALQTNLELYEKAYGKIEIPKEQEKR